MMIRRLAFLAVTVLALATACDRPKRGLSGPILDNFGVVESEGSLDCDGLDPSHCMFPFPTDYYRQQGPGGPQLVFGENTLPKNKSGTSMDPKYYREYDGYSPITPILFRFPTATLDGTVDQFHIPDSLSKSSKTLVIEADTGRLIPHWAEFDHFSLDDGKPVIVLRTAVRLEFSKRYVVAVQGLVDAAGALVPASPGFAALRDQTASTVIGVHGRRVHFENNVFPVISKAGVARTALQLAFDFTTISEANSTTRLLTMRRKLFEIIGEDGPQYEIKAVEQRDDPDLAYTIRAVAYVPSFLLPRQSNGIRRLRVDSSGDPIPEGTESVAFDLHIPHSVVASETPVALLQYGHGFLQSKLDGEDPWLKSMANRKGFIVMAADMQGLTGTDGVLWAARMTQSVSIFPEVLESPLQGVMNHFALVRLMKGRFQNETNELLRRNGGPIYDPSRIYYYGNSQGGTMGSLMMSLQKDVTRGVLGVPGCAFSLLLHRSSEFTPFVAALRVAYPDVVEFAAIFGIMQQGFNHFEPLHFVHRMTENPWPDTPSHRVMLHLAKEDAQVATIVSYLLGRTIGAKLMSPPIFSVYGFDEVPYPYEGNSMIEYDFLVPDNPKPTYPAVKETDTHGLLRKLPIGQDQVWHFLETGETIAVCDGPCNPE